MQQYLQHAVWAAACAILPALAAPSSITAQAPSSPLASVGQPQFADNTYESIAVARTGAVSDRRILVRSTAMHRAAHATLEDTLAFAHRAVSDGQLEAVPVLEQMSTASRDPIISGPALLGAAAELRSAREGASVIQLLDRTSSSLEAMCADATGDRRRSCRSLTIDLTAARTHLRAGRKPEARKALGALSRHADEAVKSGAFAQWEGTVIGETAKYALDRL
jgi:hypothetical protein